jgi:hypothetical protein
MPLGYEFGFANRLDVVRTTPQDWENTTQDFSAFIKIVNRLKQAIPVLSVEGHWEVISTLNAPTTILSKSSSGLDPLLVVINKDWHNVQVVELPVPDEITPQPLQLIRPNRDGKLRPLPTDGKLKLEPAEIAFLTATSEGV